MVRKRILILLILTVLLFTSCSLVPETLEYEEPSHVVSESCMDSLDCEYSCMNFYGSYAGDHFLECRYKCLTLMNCKGE